MEGKLMLKQTGDIENEINHFLVFPASILVQHFHIK